jgi:hypothetical protein
MREALIRRIGMAGHTAVAVVDRVGKNGSVHKHGDSSSMKGPGQFPILMTHHAVLILLGI